MRLNLDSCVLIYALMALSNCGATRYGKPFQRWGQGDLNPHSLATCGF
jgi:hypothetical protein